MIDIKALSQQVTGIRAGQDEGVQALIAIAEQLGRIADLMDSEAGRKDMADNVALSYHEWKVDKS